MPAQDSISIDLDKLDFFSEQVLSDPFPAFAQMRVERPVMRFHQATFGRDQYVVSTHELVTQVFLDNETYSSKTKEIFTGLGKMDPEVEAIYATSYPDVETLLTSDEPDHTRLRALSMAAFAPSRVKRMTGIIGDTISSLIDQFIERGECDFVREFAVPLPINAIGAILGVSPDYYDKLYDWTFSIIRRDGQMGTREEKILDAHRVVEMKEFVASLVEQRRSKPGDDLISDLVTARVDGESPFTDLEIMATIVILMIGGSETTRSALIAVMARLLTTPDQFALLENDLTLVPNVIDEVLRLESPGAAMWRIATRDIEIGGVKISKGGVLMLRMDSANRDGAVFEDPDTFNILRSNSRDHVAFGKGIHHCIGFRLAREELNQSIPALLTRLNDLHLIEEKCDLRAHPSIHTRCLRAVSIGFAPGSKIRS